MVTVRELKHRHKVLLANGQAIPHTELPIDLPVSTGKPLADAALLEKIVDTAQMNDTEHLARVWHLLRTADSDEIASLGAHRRGLLNDFKMALTLRAWREEDEDLLSETLAALPVSWRILFPVAVVKPAAVFLTGWRRDIEFRLVEPRFADLRTLYAKILEEIGEVHLVKYRASIHMATALIGYSFQTPREKAIHDWCYANGSHATAIPLIRAYVDLREALRKGNLGDAARALESSQDKLPLTSYLGLLGLGKVNLRTTANRNFRDYAIRCASTVESILRLREWSPWLTEAHADTLGRKITSGATHLGVPFHRFVKAYLSVPPKTKAMFTDRVFLPLLSDFGRSLDTVLPANRAYRIVMPEATVHLMSVLFHSILAAHRGGSLLLLGSGMRGWKESTALGLKELSPLLSATQEDFEAALLKELGGAAKRYVHRYNAETTARCISHQDPEDLLVLDMPFFGSTRVLSALLPFERVLNLSSYYGSPSEISIQQRYFEEFLIRMPGREVASFYRYSDTAAAKLTEYVDRLYWVEQLSDGRDA